MKLKNIWIYPLGNNKGGLLVSFSVLLLFCMGLIYFYSYLGSWIRLEQNLFKTCYAIETKTFSQNKKRLQNLLKLNPTARTLRLEKIKIEAEMAVAAAQQNLILLAKLQIQYQNNFKKRKKLDQIQKNTIQLANTEFQRSHLRLIKNLNSIFKSEKRLHNLIQETSSASTSLGPSLAIQPDSPDIAPAYELQSHFEKKQAWSISWNMGFISSSQLASNLLDWKVKRICSTTLSQNAVGNFEIIPADRFLSNSLSSWP